MPEASQRKGQKNKYARNRLTEFGFQYIENLKTPEAWLRFAKFQPPEYIRRCLLITGYDIRNECDFGKICIPYQKQANQK